MPLIQLETTSDLQENAQVPDILEALVQEVNRFASIGSGSTKAYHALRSVWAVSEGDPPGIAHCTLKMLSVGDPGLLSEITDRVQDVLRLSFAESLAHDEVSVSLEVVGMTSALYRE